MRTTDVLIIGGGQAGLAMSAALSGRGIDHLVLERGRIAERWRGLGPRSLRLLTPNWMTRLPGGRYDGPDPDGFMHRDELVAFLGRYARTIAAPVIEGAAVRRARAAAPGFMVDTDAGTFLSRALVVATGHCDIPRLPDAAADLDPSILQLHAASFRAPEALPPGGVLVVGASASGVQIAAELAAAGRPVTLSVGRHIRVPRRYRGADIFRWLDRAGILGQRTTELPSPAAALRQPSMQLVGRPDNRDIDLSSLAAAGVRLAGRLSGATDRTVAFADDLAATTIHADAKLRGLLDRFDAIAGGAPSGPRPDPVLAAGGPARLDLRAEGIAAVVWATGYSRRYDWLQVPVLCADGEIRHSGGVTAVDGLVVLGLRMLRHRSSSFIGGVGRDALDLARHLHVHLEASARKAA